MSYTSVGAADLFDAALVQDRDPVGHVERLGLIVGHQHGGHVHLVVQAAQPRPQIFADLGVERTERFVQEQHLRVHRESAGERHALALPAGELTGVTGLEAGEADDLEQVVDLLLDLRLGSLADLQPETDVVPHGEVLERGVVLEHEPDAATLGRHTGDVLPLDRDGAGVRLIEARDGPKQGGLPRPAGAEQCGQ